MCDAVTCRTHEHARAVTCGDDAVASRVWTGKEGTLGVLRNEIDKCRAEQTLGRRSGL